MSGSPAPEESPTPSPTSSPTTPALSSTPPLPGEPAGSARRAGRSRADRGAGVRLDADAVGLGGGRVSFDLGSRWAHQWVYLVFYSAPTIVGWAQADGSGVVATTVPAGLVIGERSLAAFDGDGGVVALAAVELTAASPGDDSGDELPDTGSEALQLLPFALLMLATGAGAVGFARRRQVRLNN